MFDFIYFSGMMAFCFHRKYLLLMLMSLEMIVLSIYMKMFMDLSMYIYEYYFSLIFMTMSVCEGALGLMILVSLIRTHGEDYFFNFNILW